MLESFGSRITYDKLVITAPVNMMDMPMIWYFFSCVPAKHQSKQAVKNGLIAQIEDGMPIFKSALFEQMNVRFIEIKIPT